jgi:hypothetical protein
MSQSDIVPKTSPEKTKPLRSSSAGRVGGDPPKISFLALGAKMGSSVGVKSHQIL